MTAKALAPRVHSGTGCRGRGKVSSQLGHAVPPIKLRDKGLRAARAGHALPFSRRHASEFCQSQVHEKPFVRKATRTKNHARSEWSAGRRRGRGPRHADGCCHPPTLRAWRAPQNDPLARTACFGRAAPPGAPPPSRLSAAAVDRRRLRAAFRSCQPKSPAGVLTERIDSLCNGKRDRVKD